MYTLLVSIIAATSIFFVPQQDAKRLDKTAEERALELRTRDKIKPRDEPPARMRRTPGVFVKNEQGVAIPLGISKLDATVEITGTMAITTLDITVSNPHNRVLEGEFNFPLEDGQTVARFALDINGKLRDAVVVPKEKARETFEEVIRTKIDPALLEWTRDNSFKTRIYPIPANGERRVLISYEQQLLVVPDGLSYNLPFAFSEPIGTFTFNATVAGFGTQPTLTGSDEPLEFSPRGRIFDVEFSRENVTLNRSFSIAVPVIVRDPLIRVGTFEDEHYFSAFIPNDVVGEVPRTINSVALFWDASISGLRRDVERELRALDAFFEKVGSVNVEYTVFANTIRSTGSVQVVNGDWSLLRSILTLEPFDGATQLGLVEFNKTRADIAILVSDGIATFGTKNPILGSTPVFVLSTGVPADYDVLRHMANTTGGKFIDARAIEADDVANMLTTTQRTITEIEVIAGTLSDVYPQTPFAIQHITTIVGKLVTSGARIRIVSSVNGYDVKTNELTISKNQHEDTARAIPRMWATEHLRALSGNRQLNEAQITETGMKFNVVTPNTSLLVLERLFDYVRFNIKPPANEPELVQQFVSARSKVRTDSLMLVQAHQQQVSRMIERRKQLLANRVNVDSVVTAFEKRRSRMTASDTLNQLVVFGDREKVRATDRGSIRIGSDYADVEAPSTAPKSMVTSGGKFVVRGSRTTETQVLVDGLDVTDQFTGGYGSADTRKTATNNFIVRCGRKGEEPVLVEGLTITDQFTGGLGNSGENISASMPSPLTEHPLEYEVKTLDKNKGRLAVVDSLKNLSTPELYWKYLSLRNDYAEVTSFYVDVAETLLDRDEQELALRVLSNLAELRGEDHRDLRILAHKLLQMGHADLAVSVFTDVKNIRQEEPQSYRDLAIAYEALGEYNQAAKNYLHVLRNKWHRRFAEIELIVAMEYSHLVAKRRITLETNNIVDKYLVASDVGLRVVLSWDADNCDMDLWIEDPLGEVCKYSHRKTKLGGNMSYDLTGGYGPEEFILPNAAKGTYKIKVHYYGNRQQNVDRPTTFQVNTFTNYGSATEKHSAITMRLEGSKQLVDVGTITVN